MIPYSTWSWRATGHVKGRSHGLGQPLSRQPLAFRAIKTAELTFAKLLLSLPVVDKMLILENKLT